MNELAEQLAREKEQQRIEDERRAEAAKEAAQELGITGSFWAYNEPLKEKEKQTLWTIGRKTFERQLAPTVHFSYFFWSR